jgi:hypothetical protein
MHTPEIRADVELVVVHQGTFFFKHSEWLQRGDSQIGNRPGVISRHIGVRYYLMLTELDSWYDLDARGMEFAKYRDIIASLPAIASAPDQEPRTAQQVRIEQETKTNNFLMRARDSLVKHFSWCINELLFLSLHSEGSTARVVARFLTGAAGASQTQGDDTHESDIHKTTINLTRFLKFLESECDEEERQKTWQFLRSRFTTPFCNTVDRTG